MNYNNKHYNDKKQLPRRTALITQYDE